MDALAGLTFALPERLWLLAVVPPALLLLIARERHRLTVADRFVSERLRGRSNGLRGARPWLITLALACGVTASAGPRLGEELRELPSIEANTIIVLDLSESMAARDVGTSRLSAAKAVAKRIIEASPSRFGLVVFEGEAETVSPFTEDHEAVVTLLDSLDTAELPAAGSDIGAAITEAIELAKSVGDRATDVVIISDGEHRGKDWQSALGVARTRGLRISAVVIGTEQGATIPDAGGEPLKDDSGAEIVTRASREPLETITKDCGGKLWMNPFEQITIGSVGKDALRNKPGDRFERIPVERYQWPLGAAFVLFVGAMIVNRGAE